MSQYQQPAGADYSAWQWETMLASVLNLAVPGRGEVTGQPWLTIQHDGQGDPGSHLVWTAGWKSSPGAGTASIQVYLSPTLYNTGGAWDRFSNAPAQALSGAAAGNYSALPLNPPTFQSASVALASLATGLGAIAQQLGSLHQDASSGAAAFKGNTAGVVGGLLGGLRTTTLSLHDQLTSPVSYSSAIAAAGDSAVSFLAALESAYASWTQLPEHSPLGAVVRVLTQVASQDVDGSLVIPDPRNTSFGDLTTDGAWAPVEQQAKSLWLSALTGDSGDFGGLDPLGRSALGRLVDQYSAAMSAIVPLVGPAPSAIAPNAVGGSQNGTRNGPSTLSTLSTSGTPGAGSGPATAAAVAPGGGMRGSAAPQPGALRLGAAMTANMSVGGASAGTIGATAQGAGSGPAAAAGAPDNAIPGSGIQGSAAPQSAALLPAAAMMANVSVGGALAGAIGATDGGTGRTGYLAAAVTQNAAFTGTIGSPSPAGSPNAGPAGQSKGTESTLGASRRLVPAAGFALGRDPNGSPLQQSAVSAMAGTPSAVTSSPVNVQLVPGGEGKPGSSLPGGSPVSDGLSVGIGPGAGGSAPSVVGDAGGVLAGAAAQAGPTSGTGGLRMMPPPGLGVGGQPSGERERLSYLPEDEDHWGVVGIGAVREPAASQDTMPDRRTP